MLQSQERLQADLHQVPPVGNPKPGKAAPGPTKVRIREARDRDAEQDQVPEAQGKGRVGEDHGARQVSLVLLP